MAQVITNNLKRSGLFAPIDPAAFIERITNIDTAPQWQSWKQIGATYLVYKTNSIFTGMILHAFVNGYATFVVMHPTYDWTGVLRERPSLWSLAGIVLIAFSILIFNRREKEITSVRAGV